MSPAPLARGNFVRTLFPFGPPARSDRPGPVRHVADVLAADSTSVGSFLLLAYTSSGPWRDGKPLPQSVVEFDGGGPADRTARVPSGSALPRAAPGNARAIPGPRPGAGVVGRADSGLRDRLEAMFGDLVRRRRDLIEVRGPR